MEKVTQLAALGFILMGLGLGSAFFHRPELVAGWRWTLPYCVTMVGVALGEFGREGPISFEEWLKGSSIFLLLILFMHLTGYFTNRKAKD